MNKIDLTKEENKILRDYKISVRTFNNEREKTGELIKRIFLKLIRSKCDHGKLKKWCVICRYNYD